MLKVGLIVGSTRPNRFADKPAQWLVDGASARPDLHLTVLDLRDNRLPFFNEPAPFNSRRRRNRSGKSAIARNRTIAVRRMPDPL